MSDRLIEFAGRPEVWAAVAGLVGFVALTWMIRRAPLGQAGPPESAGAPAAAARDRAVIAAVLGFLAILLGGLLAARVGLGASIPAFAVGVGLVRWVVATYRGQRHESPTIRRLVAFAETTLTATLLGGILILGNVAALRYGGRPIDLTRDRAFSLSTLTLAQLNDLDRPVTLTVFFGNSARSRRQFERVQQLTEMARVANPDKVRVEYLDPFKDLAQFETLARRVPDVVSSNDGLVITYGDGAEAPHAVLGTRELFEEDGSPANRFASTFRGEDALTSTLIRLREGKRTRVAFAVGHNEPSIQEADPNRPGYGLWRSRLASVGADAVEVNLLQDEVPADISLLVLAGPKAPFQPAEVERIRQHLARGGPILALLDNAAPSGLDELLANYNVTIGAGVAAEPRLHYANRPTIVYAGIPASVQQPIVASLANQVALFQNAAPLAILGPGGAGAGAAGSPGAKRPAANPGILATPILRTSPESWVEADPQVVPARFDRGPDQAGPALLGVAATTRPALAKEVPVPRLVVFSSPSLADNRLLRAESTNIDLLMNAVSWLRRRPDQIGIAPKTHESQVFLPEPGLQLRLVLVPTLAAVVVIVGLGLTIYLARRD